MSKNIRYTKKPGKLKIKHKGKLKKYGKIKSTNIVPTAKDHLLLSSNLHLLYMIASDSLKITRGNIKLEYVKGDEIRLYGAKRAITCIIKILQAAPELGMNLATLPVTHVPIRTKDENLDLPSPILEINNNALSCVREIFRDIKSIKNKDLHRHIEYVVSYFGYTEKSKCDFVFPKY